MNTRASNRRELGAFGHRPASRAVRSDADGLRERDFEVTERQEETAVEKRAREVEEVVVRSI